MVKPNKKQPIVPVFSGERPHGEVIEGIYFPSREQSYIELKEGGAHPIKPETLQMSLDGKEWYSMGRIEELIELGLQYEWAIESLAKENDDEQRK